MLLISEPGPFYCESDEDSFFAWLKSIPAVKAVTGTALGLEIALDEPVDRLSFYEIVGLFTRYGLDRRQLRLLCESNEDPWFHDPKNYWYAAVFGSDT